MNGVVLGPIIKAFGLFMLIFIALPNIAVPVDVTYRPTYVDLFDKFEVEKSYPVSEWIENYREMIRNQVMDIKKPLKSNMTAENVAAASFNILLAIPFGTLFSVIVVWFYLLRSKSRFLKRSKQNSFENGTRAVAGVSKSIFRFFIVDPRSQKELFGIFYVIVIIVFFTYHFVFGSDDLIGFNSRAFNSIFFSS